MAFPGGDRENQVILKGSIVWTLRSFLLGIKSGVTLIPQQGWGRGGDI